MMTRLEKRYGDRAASYVAALSFVAMVTGAFAWAAPEGASAGGAATPDAAMSSAPPPVKYKTGKDVSFDELLIQGQLQRPEVSVVTGDLGQGNELLRLRENFLDRAATDFGEDVQ